MKGFLLLAAVMAAAVAKPEMYREKEDFKYSRSSSDEGTKAGFYGAQRGNMGGNYERAHNMDTLAQHQMSGLVRQVDGELGDGAKTRIGSVYSAANSRGIYGSGNYDLSNLEGRNFQEGVSYGESQASSLSQESAYNTHLSADSRADYRSSQSHNARHQSGYNAYQSGRFSGQDSQSSNLYSTGELNAIRNNDYGGQDSLGYFSNTGHHRSNSQSSTDLDRSHGLGSDSRIRIISAMPVRVVVRPRPGDVNAIASQTYDSTHRDSSFNQNVVGSETETLNNQNLHKNIQPPNDAKHFESAYSYRKEWEKHDTVPVIVPTPIPYPKNSELYEDNQASTSDHSYDTNRRNTNMQSSNGYSRYQNHAKSASSSQSHQQFDYNAQHETSGSNLDAYGYQAHVGGTAAALSLDNHNDISNSKPKSYQASYSYHKSWERQGDPYVIKPATNDFSGTSQRLTSNNQYGSHNYDSQHRSSHTKSSQHYFDENAADCDESSHVRVARSYDNAQQNQFVYEDQEAQNLEDLGQQSHTRWEDLNSQTQQQLGQHDQQWGQNKWDNLESLDQQTQSKWNLGDLGQQTQNAWTQENAEQKQLDKLQNLGQETQNQWELQTTGQQTQGAWDNFEQSQQNRRK